MERTSWNEIVVTGMLKKNTKKMLLKSLGVQKIGSVVPENFYIRRLRLQVDCSKNIAEILQQTRT